MRHVRTVAVCLFVCAGTLSARGGVEGPETAVLVPPIDVATGLFNCRVIHVDPPISVSTASASLMFTGTASLTPQGIGSGIDLGAGIDATCEGLSAQMLASAAQQCSVGALGFREDLGGNYQEKDWFFSLVCKGPRNNVMNAIGTLLGRLITMPTSPVAAADARPPRVVPDPQWREFLETGRMSEPEGERAPK